MIIILTNLNKYFSAKIKKGRSRPKPVITNNKINIKTHKLTTSFSTQFEDA